LPTKYKKRKPKPPARSLADELAEADDQAPARPSAESSNPPTPPKDATDEDLRKWIQQIPEKRTFSKSITNLLSVLTRLRKSSTSPDLEKEGMAKGDNQTPGRKSARNTRGENSPDQEKDTPKEEPTWEEEYGSGGKIEVPQGALWRSTSDIIKLLRETTKNFSEGSAANLVDWLHDFARSLYRINVPSGTGVSLLPFFLRHPALGKYNSLEERDKVDWKATTEALIKLHQCSSDRQLAAQEITALRQGKMSVSEFAEKLRKLGRYAYEYLGKEARDRLTATHLLNRVSKDIRVELRRLPTTPVTLKEMKHQADRIEKTLALEAGEEEEEALIAAIKVQFPDQTRQWSQQGGRRQWQDRGVPLQFQNLPMQQGSCPHQCSSVPVQYPYPGNYNNQQWYGRNHGPYQFQDPRRQPGPAPQPAIEAPPPQHQGQTRGQRPGVNSVSKFLLLVVALSLLPTTAPLQICGFGRTGNSFVAPSPIACTGTSDVPLQRHEANIYTARPEALELEAFKCIRTLIHVRKFSFLTIYSTIEKIIVDQTTSIPVEECRKASQLRSYQGHELKEVAPGLFRTEAVGNWTDQQHWFGTKEENIFELTMQRGTIASTDGNNIISELGSMEQCAIHSGHCQDEESTTVWEKHSVQRECPFQYSMATEAIMSPDFVAIPALDIFSAIDKDVRKLHNIMEECHFNNAILTDDGLLIELPTLLYQRPRHTAFWLRTKRELATISGGANHQPISVDIRQNFSVPLIFKLYKKRDIMECPIVHQNIADPMLLREFKRFNVTKTMLERRTRLYPEDRNHPRNYLLIALKSIRIAQYSWREKRRLTEQKRDLTEGEMALLRLINEQDVFIFDKLLAREFGESTPDIVNQDHRFPLPTFDEKRMAQERLEPYMEPSWSARPPPPPIFTTTTTEAAPYRPPPPTRPPPATSTTTTSRPTTSAPTMPRPTTSVPNITTEKPAEQDDKKQESKKTIEESFRNACKNQYVSTSLFETILAIDPTAAVHQLLKRRDISAKRIGDSILFRNAEPVVQATMHWDRKVNNICYDLVPVTVEDVLWFQLPGSEDLVAEAVVIPCHERQPIIHREGSKWIGMNNREVNPQRLGRPFRRTQTQYLLDPPRTFYTTLEEETGVSTGSDKENERRFDRYQRNLEHTLETNGILHDGWNMIRNATQNLHKSAKEIYHNTIDAISKGARKVFFSILQLLIWISIPLLIILLCIGFVYGYTKYMAFRKMTRLAGRAARTATDELLERTLARINNVELRDDIPAHPQLARSFDQEYPLMGINTLRINHIQAARIPHIDVILEGKKLEALFDTGAGVTYAPISSISTKLNTSVQPTAVAANGSTIQFLGTTKSTINIGNLQVKHDILVSKDSDCPAPMLIGTDVMEKINKIGHNVSINLHKKQIFIGSSMIPINAISGI
uniref:Retrotransposon gag domain-containing protein n=1 Tax=Caenorhabditis japonica TaxID=281687 RepID=A0A8R1HJN8_CAEJA